MKMSEVKVGMRLKSKITVNFPIATVTELTKDGFRYEYDNPFYMGSRIGMTGGGEHFGIDGEAFYEPLVDLSAMNRGFPFRWISEQFDTDYGVVLALVEAYDAGYLLSPWCEDHVIFFTIYAACKAPWRWKFAKEISPGVQECGLWCDGYGPDDVRSTISRPLPVT